MQQKIAGTSIAIEWLIYHEGREEQMVILATRKENFLKITSEILQKIETAVRQKDIEYL